MTLHRFNHILLERFTPTTVETIIALINDYHDQIELAKSEFEQINFQEIRKVARRIREFFSWNITNKQVTEIEKEGKKILNQIQDLKNILKYSPKFLEMGGKSLIYSLEEIEEYIEEMVKHNKLVYRSTINGSVS